MSVSEIKSELKKLSAQELAEIEGALRELQIAANEAPRPLADFLGCGRGLMILKPGWDEDEPPDMWEALHDEAHF